MDQNNQPYRQEHDGGSFFGGLLIGSLIGAAVALLTAPASGVQTRTKLRDAGEEAIDRGTKLTEDARERAEAIVAEAQRKAQRVAEVARDSVEVGKAEMNRFVENEKDALRA